MTEERCHLCLWMCSSFTHATQKNLNFNVKENLSDATFSCQKERRYFDVFWSFQTWMDYFLFFNLRPFISGSSSMFWIIVLLLTLSTRWLRFSGTKHISRFHQLQQVIHILKQQNSPREFDCRMVLFFFRRYCVGLTPDVTKNTFHKIPILSLLVFLFFLIFCLGS